MATDVVSGLRTLQSDDVERSTIAENIMRSWFKHVTCRSSSLSLFEEQLIEFRSSTSLRVLEGFKYTAIRSEAKSKVYLRPNSVGLMQIMLCQTFSRNGRVRTLEIIEATFSVSEITTVSPKAFFRLR